MTEGERKVAQGLLNKYVQAQLSVISEWSGAIASDARMLRAEAGTYAQTLGLYVDDRLFEAYGDDDA
jgi:hypothetical protein